MAHKRARDRELVAQIGQAHVGAALGDQPILAVRPRRSQRVHASRTRSVGYSARVT